VTSFPKPTAPVLSLEQPATAIPTRLLVAAGILAIAVWIFAVYGLTQAF
jgi:hypothetical protein